MPLSGSSFLKWERLLRLSQPDLPRDLGSSGNSHLLICSPGKRVANSFTILGCTSMQWVPCSWQGSDHLRAKAYLHCKPLSTQERQLIVWSQSPQNTMHSTQTIQQSRSSIRSFCCSGVPSRGKVSSSNIIIVLPLRSV